MPRPVDWLLAAVVVAHVLAAPFTKVEESFNLQATHDLLFHRTRLAAFDHHEFPGVVPRSFAGALSLAAASAPLVALLQWLHAPRLAALLAVRTVLGLALTASFARLRRALATRLGHSVGDAFMLLTALQFHLPFYMSRTLANTFALGVSTVACAEWLEGRRPGRVVALLVFATAVLRCDCVLLLAPVGLHLLLSRQLSLRAAAAHGMAALAASLAVSVPVDGLLWGRTLWPEGEVLWFNAVRGGSEAWGTSPWHWYATSALPRALLGALPLALMGCALERRLWPQAFATLFYVALYSRLPHKELRFLFPVLPLCNALAAAALVRAWRNRRKSRTAALLAAACAGLLLLTLGGKLAMTWAAHWNYPGGWALAQLRDVHCPGAAAAAPRVHVDVLPAMTGVSRFGDHPGWALLKTEGLRDEELAGFTHLLSARQAVPGFVAAAALHGSPRLRLQPALMPLALHTEPQVWVHCRAATQGQ